MLVSFVVSSVGVFVDAVVSVGVFVVVVVSVDGVVSVVGVTSTIVF